MNKKFGFCASVLLLSMNVGAVEIGTFDGTSVSVGGYFKAEGDFYNPDVGDTKFEGTAGQSRLNFTAKKNVNGHRVVGFAEGDFYGGDVTDSSYDFRLRHAFIKVDNLTIGKTWSGQFLATVPFDVPFLDFFNGGKGNLGGNGGVVRPDLTVHYEQSGARLSLQSPINNEAAYPDFVLNYARTLDNGLALSIAFAGRDVAKSNSTNNSNDSEFGGSVIYASKYTYKDTGFHINGYTGKGQGIYAGFGYGGPWSPGLRPVVDVDANGELIKTSGLVAGISHKFTDSLRGAIRYAQIKADDTAPGSEDKFDIKHVNLIYTYFPELDFGIEWREQNLPSHPTRPAGQQVEVMAMYKF